MELGRESPSPGVWLQLHCSLFFSNIPITFTNFLVLDCPILLQQLLPTLTSTNTSTGPPLVDVPPLFYIALRYQEVTFICNYVCGYVVPSFLTNFGALYLTEFSTNFGQILDSNSYDQA